MSNETIKTPAELMAWAIHVYQAQKQEHEEAERLHLTELQETNRNRLLHRLKAMGFEADPQLIETPDQDNAYYPLPDGWAISYNRPNASLSLDWRCVSCGRWTGGESFYDLATLGAALTSQEQLKSVPCWLCRHDQVDDQADEAAATEETAASILADALRDHLVELIRAIVREELSA